MALPVINICIVLVLVLKSTSTVQPGDDWSVPGEWSEWSECSVSCGVGKQSRNRSCEGCLETRRCDNTPCMHDATLMMGVVIGVSSVLISSLVVVLVCTFFLKGKSEKKLARNKSSLAEWSTPGMSRRTITIDSAVDLKLSIIRRDQRQNSIRNTAATSPL